MNEQELETLIVRLIGDATEYRAMLSEAAKASEEAAVKVQEAAEKVEGFEHSLVEFAEVAHRALAAFGLAEVTREATNDYNQLEGVNMRLTALVKANGEQVQETMENYKGLSEEMEKMTTMSHKTTLELIQMAEAMGKTGESAKKLVKDAAAFAAVTGQGAETGYRLALALQMGNTFMLRYALGLRGIKDESEILRIAHIRLQAGMELVDQQAKTAEGRWKQVSNVLEGVMETIGEKLTPTLKSAADSLKIMLGWWDRIGPAAQNMIVAILGVVTVLITFSVTVSMAKLALNTFTAALAANPITALIAAATIAVVVVAELANVMYESSRAAKEAKESVEALQKTLDKDTDRVHKAVQNTKEMIPSFEDPAKRLEYLKEQLKTARDKVDEWDEAIDKIAAKHFGKSGLGAHVREANLTPTEKAQVDALEKQRDALQEAADEYAKLADDMTNTKPSEAAVREAKNLSEKFKEQAATAGMAGDEAEIYKAKLKYGLLPAQVDTLTAMAKQAEEAKKVAEAHKKLTEEVESTSKGFKEEIDTFGMSANQKKIWKLQQDGATEAVVNLAKAQADYLDLLTEAKKVHEESRTPQEKYYESVSKLHEELDKGLISWAEYQKAVGKAAKELQTVHELQKVQQAGAGTAEARSRVEAYFEKQKGVETNPVVAKVQKSNDLLEIIAEALKAMQEANKNNPINRLFNPAGLGK